MSAPHKWVSPTILTVDDRGGSPAEADTVVRLPAPVVLSGELRDGDAVVADDGADAEMLDVVTEVRGVDAEVGPGGGRALRWFILIGLVFIVAVTVQDSVLFLQEQFARHHMLGWGFSALAAGMMLALTVMVVREIVAWRKLRSVQYLQDHGSKLRKEGEHGRGVPFTMEMMRFYQGRAELEPGWQRFHDQLDPNLGDREILTLFSSDVLSVLDKKAYDIVVENSSVAALLTTLSPMAWLDAMLFMWRNVRMVRQIAACYGFRPGFMVSVKLMQEVFQGMVASATTDILTSEAVDTVGSSVTAAIFAKAGQGMANGLLSARIGVQAMRLCRPVAFLENENPSLKRVRSEMLERVKERMG